METRTNQQWLLAKRPKGMAQRSDFEWVIRPVPELAPGQILVRTIYLSLDPTNRGWMRESPTYLPPVRIGEVMRGIAVGVVEETRNQAFQGGDLVQGMLGWQRFCLTDGTGLRVVPRIPGLPLTAHLAVLGHIGLTAHYGLLEIGSPKRGETLVVSAAAGAVGSITGQIGKIQGCHVVGIAGSDEKCAWLTKELGFDAAINYRSGSVPDQLRQACPQGIDIYFDNVGGEILDAALALINLRARVVICGLISQYNAERPVPGPSNFANILLKRARVEGFIVLDYLDRAEAAIAELARWLLEGRIRYRVDLVDGLEQAPEAMNRLFVGANIGKLLVRVSEEPH